MNRAGGPFGVLLRLSRFTKVMYKPHYLLYGVLWVLALEATAALVTRPDEVWRPTGASWLRVVIVAFVLLYLRMVDEQKDLDYDRVHNPDRPLVTGAVTAADLRIGMAVIAVGAVAASAALSIASAVAIAVVSAYGLGLWGLEVLSARVKNDILVNLVVTYPVQLLVTAYVVVSARDTGEVGAGWAPAAVALVFAGAFLQFEFARKTSRRAQPGQTYYSNVLGANGSVAVAMAFVAVAVVADLLLARPWDQGGPRAWVAWLPLVSAVVPLTGAVRFSRSGRADYPLLPAVGFILVLYTVLIAQAAVSPG